MGNCASVCVCVCVCTCALERACMHTRVPTCAHAFLPPLINYLSLFSVISFLALLMGIGSASNRHALVAIFALLVLMVALFVAYTYKDTVSLIFAL